MDEATARSGASEIGRPRARGAELRFVLFVAGLMACLTSVPYLVGLNLADPKARFDGVLVFDQDINCYLAFMRQASHGQLLFHNPFTAEPHGNVFFNLEWLVGGWIAAIPGSSLELAFHILRVLGIFGLTCALYRLCAELFVTPRVRRIVFLALLTGGGFGWLIVVPGLKTHLEHFNFLDTYAGLHPFFWMLLEPHFVLGQLCAILTLTEFLRAEAGGSFRRYLSTGLLVTLTGAVRPFDMLVLLATFALYLLATAIGKRETSRAVLLRRSLPLLVPLPLLGYQYALFHFHPVFRWWSIQNISVPADPLSLGLSLGLVGLLLLGALGNLGDFRDKPHARVVMACTLLASVGVIYSFPLFQFTLQAVTTLAVPAVLVATQRLESVVLDLTRRRVGIALVTGLLLFNAASSAVLFGQKLSAVERGESRTGRELVEAYRWFDGHAGPRDVIMAALESGNRIPRYALATTFYGQNYATVDAPAKRRMTELFYGDSTSNEQRLWLVKKFDIHYIFHGEAERALGTWEPARVSWLTEVFRNGAAAIYAVR